MHCHKWFCLLYLYVLEKYWLIISIFIDPCYTWQTKGGKGTTRRKRWRGRCRRVICIRGRRWWLGCRRARRGHHLCKIAHCFWGTWSSLILHQKTAGVLLEIEVMCLWGLWPSATISLFNCYDSFCFQVPGLEPRSVFVDCLTSSPSTSNSWFVIKKM